TEQVSYAKDISDYLLFDELRGGHAGAKTGRAVSARPCGGESVYLSSRPGSRAQVVCWSLRSLPRPERRRRTRRHAEYGPISLRQFRPRNVPCDPQWHS